MLLKEKPKVFLVRLFFGEAMGEQPGDAAGKSTALPVISVHTALMDTQCHQDLTEHEHAELQVSVGGKCFIESSIYFLQQTDSELFPIYNYYFKHGGIIISKCSVIHVILLLYLMFISLILLPFSHLPLIGVRCLVKFLLQRICILECNG